MSAVNDCGIICCSGKHNFYEVNGFLKLNNKELAELQQCLIRERYQCCRFCKKCLDCRRFTFLMNKSKMLIRKKTETFIQHCIKLFCITTNIQNGIRIQRTN